VVHVFISYAAPDWAIADEVASWLRADGHEPFLAHDLRNGIGAGENWKQRLYDEVDAVIGVVIGVVTSSFLASPWCPAELGIADARGCLLIPLRAEAHVERPLIQDRQYVRLLDDGRGSWRATILSRGWNRSLRSSAGSFRPRGGGSRGAQPAARDEQHRRDTGHRRAVWLWEVVPAQRRGRAAARQRPGMAGGADTGAGTDPVPELARALAATATRLGLSWSASDVRSRLEAGADGLRRVADDPLAAGPDTHQRRCWLRSIRPRSCSFGRLRPP
jgi:hypothetical protein